MLISSIGVHRKVHTLDPHADENACRRFQRRILHNKIWPIACMKYYTQYANGHRDVITSPHITTVEKNIYIRMYICTYICVPA